MYRLANLLKWKGRSFDLTDENDWLDLLDDFGPALPRFLLDASVATQVPDGDVALSELRQSLVKHPVSSLKPEVGSAWVLFAFKSDLANLSGPFRKDGLLLPFEWRKGEGGHSKLLPEELVRLAEQVKAQFGGDAADCTLHPSRHFLDAVDFHIPGATFDSAWGALATGLHLLLSRKKQLAAWPFSTIAYDFENDMPKAVGGLEQKFLLAASAGAEEIAVAPVQYREAKSILKELQGRHPGDKALKRFRVYHWHTGGGFRRSVERLAKCNQWSSRKLRTGIAAACGAVGALFVLTALCAIDGRRDVYRYFQDVEQRFGRFEGVREVSASDLSKMRLYTRFRYKGRDRPLLFGGRRILRDSTLCGPSNDVVRLVGRSVNAEYFYSEDGSLSRVFFRDGVGAPVEELLFTDGETNRCEMIQYANGKSLAARGERGYVQFDENTGKIRKIEQHYHDGKYDVFTLDFRNNRKQREFFNADGSRGTDEWGTAIIVYQYAEDAAKPFSREIGRLFFNSETNRILNSLGISGYVHRFDYQNRISDLVYVDQNDEPIDSLKGPAIERTCYDEYGRKEEVCRMNSRYQRVVEPELGCCGVRMTYDYSGQCRSMAFVDENGEPMESGTLRFAKVEFTGDGLVQRVRLYSVSNTLSLCFTGVAGWDTVFDIAGRMRSRRYVGINNELRDCNTGLAEMNVEYDAQGRICEMRFRNSKGQGALAETAWGKMELSKQTIRYDRLNNETRESEIRMPTMQHGDALYFCEKISEEGRILNAWFCRESGGAPCDGVFGFAKVEVAYNDLGEYTEIVHRNAAGDLAMNGRLGFSKMSRDIVHLRDGIRVTERYYGPTHFAITNGVAAINARFTSKGRLAEIEAFDGLERPAVIPNSIGVCRISVKYDALLRVSEMTWTAIGSGEAFDGWSGMAIEYPSMASSAHVTRYDRNGRKVGETKTMPLVVLQGLLRDLDKFSFHKKPYSYISINDLNANPLMETLSQTIAH